MKNFPKRFVQSIWLYASKYLIARQSAHGFEKNLLLSHRPYGTKYSRVD